MTTDLIYMKDGNLLEYETTVADIRDTTTVVLPATIFYPQGGGQPFDTGEIRSPRGVFAVESVRNIDGVVHHTGVLAGEMQPGDVVTCVVNKERRQLNSRNHSAGHLVDLAVHEIGYNWVPGSGYAYPDGAYVEYLGDFENLDIEQVKTTIEATCNMLINQDIPVTTEFMTREAMEKRLSYVPENLPSNRPSRVVFMGDYGIPCGGTHVSSLKEIGTLVIRKIKRNGEALRVSYKIE